MKKELTVREMASKGGKNRWKGVSKEARSAHGRAIVGKRKDRQKKV